MDPVLISLVSACTALVASIVGPMVTLAVAKRQINASVLSANRQRWIESLRDLMAELISLMIAALVVKSEWKGQWDKGRGVVAEDPKLLKKLERMVLVQSKLINPNERDHSELYRSIDTAFKRIQAEDSRDADMEADIEAITRISQAILKREWERVKRGT